MEDAGCGDRKTGTALITGTIHVSNRKRILADWGVEDD